MRFENKLNDLIIRGFLMKQQLNEIAHLTNVFVFEPFGELYKTKTPGKKTTKITFVSSLSIFHTDKLYKFVSKQRFLYTL